MSERALPFRDQVALVTGASGGIGGAIVLALLEGGATVHALGRDLERLAHLRQRASDAPGTLATHRTELTRDSELAERVRELSLGGNRLDVLVHCAGRISYGTIADSPIEQLDQLYAANVRGPYLLTQLCMPLLVSSQGQVVFINSSAGLSASAGVGAYAATKHALKALADALRDEVNASGIRVLSVFPGRTATALMVERYALDGRAYHPELLLQPEDIASMVLASLGLPRTAELTNINIRPMQKSY
ncbi:MAG TPA: SDR family NAD(P)-dependent oxidoreductase [Polyangiaceae bacterium]|nr:SDR family NAD(P)-dependent oxidoreductase [Polyangiaceae bacterium]